MKHNTFRVANECEYSEWLAHVGRTLENFYLEIFWFFDYHLLPTVFHYTKIT